MNTIVLFSLMKRFSKAFFPGVLVSPTIPDALNSLSPKKPDDVDDDGETKSEWMKMCAHAGIYLYVFTKPLYIDTHAMALLFNCVTGIRADWCKHVGIYL